MTADWVIDTDALTKRYGGQILAVDNLTLRVRRGEVYGFVGPNGAGKTRVGAMIEGAAFYPFLSGRENLRVMARHSGVPFERIDHALGQVGLSPRADDDFSTYSTGMKQRLGLAAALLKDPEVLILDEPTNGLDPEGIAEMRALLRSLTDEHRTVLLSSHLMTEIEQICDRIGVIRRGRLVAEGTLDELVGGPELRVRALPVDRARELVTTLQGVDGMRVADGVLMLRADLRRAGEINRQLVDHGLEVSELTPVHATLEEVFLGLVREEGADKNE